MTGTYYAPNGTGQNEDAINLRADEHNLTDRLSRVLGRPGMRAFTELLYTVLGAAAGSAASATHARVQAKEDDGALSGLRTIETVTDVSRNTTAADVTLMKNLTTNRHAPTAYPDNLGMKVF